MSDPKWDEIIICGDWIDLWYRTEAIMAFFSILFFTDIRKKLIYVTGNHDEDSLDLLSGEWNKELKVVKEYYIETKKGTIVFVHGHQADIWNSKYRWIGKFLTKVHAWFFKIFGWDIQHSLRGKLGRFYLERYRKRLAKIYIDRADILISGHTHHPGEFLISVGERVLKHWNAGDWIKNNTFAQVAIESP